jgi:hypothetical protein
LDIKGAEAADRGELGATSAKAAERVTKNQEAQERLIENQQTQLIERIEEGIERGGPKEGATEKGRVLAEQGAQVENITRDTLEQVEGHR